MNNEQTSDQKFLPPAPSGNQPVSMATVTDDGISK